MPACVLLAWAMGVPMDLIFEPYEAVVLVLTVVTVLSHYPCISGLLKHRYLIRESLLLY